MDPDVGMIEIETNAPALHKQHEVMSKVLSNIMVTQMRQAGFSDEDIIGLAEKILDTIASVLHRNNRRGFPCRQVSTPGETPVIDVPWVHVAMGEHCEAIYGRRVVLVPFQQQHVQLLELWKATPWVQNTLGLALIDHIAQRLANADEVVYDFVIHDEGSEPIGLACLFGVDRKTAQAEIAKLLGSHQALGKGYAQEAMTLLMTYAFEVMGLGRIFLRTFGSNLHNIILNMKLGFQFEVISRASMLLSDELIDVVQMSMLASEYRKLYRPRKLEPDAVSAVAAKRLCRH